MPVRGAPLTRTVIECSCSMTGPSGSIPWTLVEEKGVVVTLIGPHVSLRPE